MILKPIAEMFMADATQRGIFWCAQKDNEN